MSQKLLSLRQERPLQATLKVHEVPTAWTRIRPVDPEGENVTLTLGGTDQEDFMFERGVLSFEAAPDYENPINSGLNNTYAVTITASDGDTQTNDITITVTIAVTNVDEPGEVDPGRPSAQERRFSWRPSLTDPDTKTYRPRQPAVDLEQFDHLARVRGFDEYRVQWPTDHIRYRKHTYTQLYARPHDDVGKYLRATRNLYRR